VVECVCVWSDVGEVLRGQHQVPAVIRQHAQDLQPQEKGSNSSSVNALCKATALGSMYFSPASVQFGALVLTNN
jgi:hypothetical protein